MQVVIDDAVANGMNPLKANQQLVDTVLTAALDQRNPAVLAVLSEVSTGSGALGNIGWVKEKVRQAETQIVNLEWQDETRQHQREDRERAEAARAVMTEAFGQILSDPFADTATFEKAALASRNPELARAIASFRETALDNAHKVRTDPQVFTQLRYRVGDTTNEAELDRVMMDVVTAANAGLLASSDVGGLMDDITQQRRNASVLSNPIVRDYRTRLGAVVQDNMSFTGPGGYTKEGGKDHAFFAVSLFDVKMRDFLIKNPEATEADMIAEADRATREVMSMERFKKVDPLSTWNVSDGSAGSQQPEAAAPRQPNPVTLLPLDEGTKDFLRRPEGAQVLKTLADHAGMSQAEYAKRQGIIK
ncbi:hypothetical protein ACUXV3_10995 [Roseobacteraceae bacterium NS-SX3]